MLCHTFLQASGSMFIGYSCINVSTFVMCLTNLHGGAVVSAVALHQEGPGFKPQPRAVFLEHLSVSLQVLWLPVHTNITVSFLRFS